MQQKRNKQYLLSLSHSCYQRNFRCMEYRPKIHYVNFDLANLFYGKCCSSKTISARRSAEGSKSPQRDALRFTYCRRRRLFILFSEIEPLLRGFPVWLFLAFLVPKLYFGVKKMCKKFREIGLDLCRFTNLRFSLSPRIPVTAVSFIER